MKPGALVMVLPGHFASVYRECPARTVALSGGYSLEGDTSIKGLLNVLGDEPVSVNGGSPTGWQVGVLNGSSETSATLSVYVVCGAVVATS